MHLFKIPKIPMYCESIKHRMEKRKSGDVKVVDLSLKIQPMTAQIAAALDPDEYGFVKRTLFKVSDGDPTVDLRAVEFRPPGSRQKLLIWSTTDSANATICIDHVKVTKIRARSSKDASGWVLCINISFGPVDKTELEFCNDFYTGQRFITWEESDPSFEFDEVEDEDDEEKPLRAGGEAPMWGDDDSPEHAAAAADETEAARPVKKRGNPKGGKRRNPEAERAKQVTDAKRRPN